MEKRNVQFVLTYNVDGKDHIETFKSVERLKLDLKMSACLTMQFPFKVEYQQLLEG